MLCYWRNKWIRCLLITASFGFIYTAAKKTGSIVRFNIAGLQDLPEAYWDKLAGEKIYFAHQSVGYNIMEGISDIQKEFPGINLRIKETNNPDDFYAPIFAHSRIGANKDPVFKIDDFRNIIEGGVGDKVDIAFLKFCYVDIEEDTDIVALFKYYTDTISRLELKYPGIKFIHCTVPLQVVANGVRARIKRWLGKYSLIEKNNIKRNIFNKILAEKYGREGRLFDLAGCESRYDNGKHYVFYQNSVGYFSLIPEYAKDLGHLNELGRKIAACELLTCLAFLNADELSSN